MPRRRRAHIRSCFGTRRYPNMRRVPTPIFRPRASEEEQSPQRANFSTKRLYSHDGVAVPRTPPRYRFSACNRDARHPVSGQWLVRSLASNYASLLFALRATVLTHDQRAYNRDSSIDHARRRADGAFERAPMRWEKWRAMKHRYCASLKIFMPRSSHCL
jgi:hypothetical protein